MTYPQNCLAIQWTGDNTDTVMTWFADNSQGPMNVDFYQWRLTDPGDGTLRLQNPRPSTPLIVRPGDWLVCAYGVIPNKVDDSVFQRFFTTGA